MRRALILMAMICSTLAISGCTQTGNNTLSESTGVPVAEVPEIAYRVSVASGTIDSIEYKGLNLSMNQCLYIFARAIVMLDSNDKGNISVREYGNPESPDGRLSSATLTRAEYVDMAGRTYRWMDQNGRVPNHVGIRQEGAGDLSPDILLRAFVRVLTEYRSTGKLPDRVTVP
ncbi:MAG: hypothetical protein PWP32_1429 [Methanothermobacter sp.]|jgi:hypothetical protein|nr:hypothetical protein [Methanothermobacter sp.]